MFRTIKSRFVAYFGLFTLINSGLFVGMSFIFMFTVEDEFIHREVMEERHRLEQSYEATGEYSSPSKSYFRVYKHQEALPEKIQRSLEQYPKEKEIFGDNGLHYHIERLKFDDALLVSEVSKLLVVRGFTQPALIVLGVMAAIMLLLSALLAYFFSKRALKPLTELSELLNSCDPEHLPKGFAAPFANNELGALANSLEKALNEVSEFVERELQFTRDASHELRTPITSILGACELLQADKQLTPQQRGVFMRIHHAAENMQKTVESLLLVARGETQLTKQPVLVEPLIEQSIINYAEQISIKQLEIECEIEPGSTLNADSQSLQIIIENLVQNAVRYTEQGGIKVHARNGVFEIKDSGSGFDFQHAKQQGVKAKNSSGFGIGLSLVERLCGVNGLSLAVESSNLGTSIKLKSIS